MASFIDRLSARIPGVLLKPIRSVIRAVNLWLDADGLRMGAAMSFYGILSLAPLLVLMVAVLGWWLDRTYIETSLVQQIQSVIGTQGALVVQQALTSAQEPSDGIIASLFAFGFLLVGATGVFAELQDSLDHIWRVDTPRRGGSLWLWLRSRLLSFGLVLGVGFLLMVSLAVSAALAAWGRWWAPWFGGGELLLTWSETNLDQTSTARVIERRTYDDAGRMTQQLKYFSPGTIYHWMPRAHIGWWDVALGSALTASLFTLGKALIGWYIGSSGVAAGYGAAGAIVALLVWVYGSAQVFLFGAEITWIFAQRHGSRRGPATATAAASAASAASAQRRG